MKEKSPVIGTGLIHQNNITKELPMNTHDENIAEFENSVKDFFSEELVDNEIEVEIRLLQYMYGALERIDSGFFF